MFFLVCPVKSLSFIIGSVLETTFKIYKWMPSENIFCSWPSFDSRGSFKIKAFSIITDSVVGRSVTPTAAPVLAVHWLHCLLLISVLSCWFWGKRKKKKNTANCTVKVSTSCETEQEGCSNCSIQFRCQTVIMLYMMLLLLLLLMMMMMIRTE